MYKLYNDDCLEKLKEIPDKSIDLILTDPPYGTTKCKWDNIIPFDEMWEELERIIKDKGAIILFGSQPFTSRLILSNINYFKYELIWDKGQGKQPLLAKIQPMKSHENILIFGKGKLTYNPQFTIGKPYSKKGTPWKSSHYENEFKGVSYKNKSTRYPLSIIKEIMPNFKGMHPTQKPVKLLEYLIKTYSNEGETVLDFTMGSGSTGVAAINTNRDFIGIELDKDYYKTAEKRIKEAEDLLNNEKE